MTPDTRLFLRPRHVALPTPAAVSLALLTRCARSAALGATGENRAGHRAHGLRPCRQRHLLRVRPSRARCRSARRRRTNPVTDSLTSTTDYNGWTTIDAGVQPHTLAGTAGSPVILATIEQRIHRSVDNGQTWTKPADSPVLLLVAFAETQSGSELTTHAPINLSFPESFSVRP